MKYGSVVIVNEIEFLDGSLDEEGYKRKCIVLFETEEQLCVCPIISHVPSFNKNPDNYYFLPFTNKNGRKFTFAKLNSIIFINKYDVLEVIDYLDNSNMIRLISKMKNNYLNYEKQEYYLETINKIEENIPVK